MNAVVAWLAMSTVIPVRALKSPYQKLRSLTLTFAGVAAMGAEEVLSWTAMSSHLPEAQDQPRAEIEPEDHHDEQQCRSKRGR